MLKKLLSFLSVAKPALPIPTAQLQAPDQIQIIQKIAESAISTAQPGWTELIIHYHVDEEQSNFANSYLIVLSDGIHEKSLPAPSPDDLDLWMRRLRAELAPAGAQPFTSCKLLVHADGKFEASYGYDRVDWGGLIMAGWNFPHVTNLH